MIGVVKESAYFFLGSPACIALVDKDLPAVTTHFFFGDLAIINSLLKHRLRVKEIVRQICFDDILHKKLLNLYYHQAAFLTENMDIL